MFSLRVSKCEKVYEYTFVFSSVAHEWENMFTFKIVWIVTMQIFKLNNKIVEN